MESYIYLKIRFQVSKFIIALVIGTNCDLYKSSWHTSMYTVMILCKKAKKSINKIEKIIICYTIIITKTNIT